METAAPQSMPDKVRAKIQEHTTNLNVISFIANVVVTYGIGVAGIGGLETNEYLSLKYQTLVTPAGWAFSIWGIIFLAQAAFVVAQVLPAYKDRTLVTEGVKDYYIRTCLAQIVWTTSFANEKIFVSFLAMLAIAYSLALILKAQYSIDSSSDTWQDYGLLRFPFEIHAGWIVAATFVNFSVFLVSLNAYTTVLFVVAVLSLIGIIAIATLSLWYLAKPNFVIPSVLAWAMVGVAVELKDPMQSIFNQFTGRTISTVRISAAFLATLMCVMVLVRAAQLMMGEGHHENEEDTPRQEGSAAETEPTSDFVKVEEDKDTGKDFVKVEAEPV